MESLQGYLEEMHEEGALDSQGHFTMGLHALNKLRAFQLSNPDFYVLRLVAAGVVLGATHLEGTSDDKAFVFLMRGIHRSEAQLNGIFEQLLAGESDPGMRDLAVGLNAALGRQPSPRILVSSWDGPQTSAIEMLQEGEQVRITALPRNSCAPPPGVSKGLLIRVHRRLQRGALDALFGGVAAPELQVLAPIARFCQVPLVINGQSLHQRLLCREPWGCALRLHPQVGPPLVFDHKSLEQKSRVWMRPESDQRAFSSLVLLHGDAAAARGLWWVHNGLVVRQGTLAGPGLVVIQSPHLRLDLSYQNLAEDETFEAIRDLVQSDLDALVSRMVRQDWHLDAIFALSSFVRHLVPRIPADESKPLLMWLLKFRSQKERDDPGYWQEREAFVEVEGPQAFRTALLGAALRRWRTGHPVAPLREIARRHLAEDDRACLLFGWPPREPVLKVLSEAAESFPGRVADYWAGWSAVLERAISTPLTSLVRADLYLAVGDLEQARLLYEATAASANLSPQGKEGLLLCRLAQPGSFVKRAALEARSGLPGEDPEVEILATASRFLHNLTSSNRTGDWRAAVREIQEKATPGPPRERPYASLARSFLLQDKAQEAALVLLVARRELALLE